MVFLYFSLVREGEDSSGGVFDIVEECPLVEVSIAVEEPAFLVEGVVAVLIQEPAFFLTTTVVLNHPHFFHRLIVAEQPEEHIQILKVQ